MARTQVATDAFTSSIDSNWTQGEGDTGTLSWNSANGGVIQPTASGDMQDRIRRNSGSYNNDQYSAITVQTASTTNGCGIGVYTRCQASSTDESSYFGGWFSPVYAQGKYFIVETNSSFGETIISSAGASAGLSGLPGATIVLENEGTALRLYTNEGSGETLRTSTTDATITSGWPGVCMWADSAVADARVTSWEGGNISTASNGTLSATLGALTSSAAISVTVDGALDKTLGALTSSSATSVAVDAALAATLGALTGSSSASVTVDGSLAATLDALTVSATASVSVNASVIMTLGTLTGVSAGSVALNASTDATLGALTVSSDAHSSQEGVNAELAAALGALTGSSTASVAIDGALSRSLDSLLCSSTASISVNAATITTLGQLTVTADGTTLVGGAAAVLDAVLGALSCSSDASIALTASVNRTLDSLTLDADGETPQLCVDLDFDPERPDFTDLVASAFLDRHGRYAKSTEAIAEVRLFFGEQYCDPVVSLTTAQYRAMSADERDQVEAAGSAAAFIDTSGKSNA